MEHACASKEQGRLSRREFFMRIAALSMATVLTIFGMKHALAAIKKISKKIAHFQSHPQKA